MMVIMMINLVIVKSTYEIISSVSATNYIASSWGIFLILTIILANSHYDPQFIGMRGTERLMSFSNYIWVAGK